MLSVSMPFALDKKLISRTSLCFIRLITYGFTMPVLRVLLHHIGLSSTKALCPLMREQ